MEFLWQSRTILIVFPTLQRVSMSFLHFILKHFQIQQTCHKVFHDRWNNMAARRSFRGEGFSSCFKTSQLWCDLNWKGQYAWDRHGDNREQFKLRVSKAAETTILTCMKNSNCVVTWMCLLHLLFTPLFSCGWSSSFFFLVCFIAEPQETHTHLKGTQADLPQVQQLLLPLDYVQLL